MKNEKKAFARPLTGFMHKKVHNPETFNTGLDKEKYWLPTINNVYTDKLYNIEHSVLMCWSGHLYIFIWENPQTG